MTWCNICGTKHNGVAHQWGPDYSPDLVKDVEPVAEPQSSACPPCGDTGQVCGAPCEYCKGLASSPSIDTSRYVCAYCEGPVVNGEIKHSEACKALGRSSPSIEAPECSSCGNRMQRGHKWECVDCGSFSDASDRSLDVAKEARELASELYDIVVDEIGNLDARERSVFRMAQKLNQYMTGERSRS